MELVRSVQARSAESVFFEDINDIDIFIEDTAFGYSKLFVTLFSRVFHGMYKVNKVFPLGGRVAVIEQHEKDLWNRPALYVIDGDLFLLIGDTIESKRGLYKFPFYCVENVLCDNLALISVLDEEDPIKDIAEVYGDFDYDGWLLNNEDKLFSLFIEYAISMILYPQQQTVAFKINDLVSNNKGEVDDAKLHDRINSLRMSVVEKTSVESYENTKRKILDNFENSDLQKLDVISGKDYLFPLLKTRGKSVVKTKVSDLNLKLRLAKVCNINHLLSAKEFVAS